MTTRAQEIVTEQTALETERISIKRQRMSDTGIWQSDDDGMVDNSIEAREQRRSMQEREREIMRQIGVLQSELERQPVDELRAVLPQMKELQRMSQVEKVKHVHQN